MATSYNMGNHKVAPQHNKNRWNVNCDNETHEALDLIGEWMMNPDAKEHIKIPKNKIIKILAKEKLKQLGLLANSKKSEAASN